MALDYIPGDWNNTDSYFYHVFEETEDSVDANSSTGTFSSPTFYPGEVWQITMRITLKESPDDPIRLLAYDSDESDVLGAIQINDFADNITQELTMTIPAWKAGSEFSPPLGDDTGVQMNFNVVNTGGGGTTGFYYQLEGVRLRKQYNEFGGQSPKDNTENFDFTNG